MAKASKKSNQKTDRKKMMVRVLCITIAGILILSTVAAAVFSNL